MPQLPFPSVLGEVLWHKQGRAASGWKIAPCSFSSEVLKRKDGMKMNANELFQTSLYFHRHPFYKAVTSVLII